MPEELQPLVPEDIPGIINEYYATVLEYLPRLGVGFFLFLLFIFMGAITSRIVNRRMRKRLDDPLIADFFSEISKWLFIIIGLAITFKVLGLQGIASSIIAGAGLGAFIIGFAFKDIGENFLSGFLLAFSRPFRIGDVIETGNFKGRIIGLTMRNTHIKTGDGKDVYIPNSMIIKQPLINYTRDGFIRHDFIVGIDFRDDPETAISIIEGTIAEVPGVLQEKKPQAIIKEFAPDTINILVTFWLDTFNREFPASKVKDRAMKDVLKALLAAGVNLPSNIRELKMYNEKEPIKVNLLGKKKANSGEQA